MYILYTPKDRVFFLIGNNRDPGALLMVFPIMSDPALSQNLMAEPGFVLFSGVAEMVFIIGVLIVLIIESVRGCTKTQHWTRPVEVLIKMLHLFGGEGKETGEDYGTVRFFEYFESGDIGSTRLDFPVFIETKKHGAVKAMVDR